MANKENKEEGIREAISEISAEEYANEVRKWERRLNRVFPIIWMDMKRCRNQKEGKDAIAYMSKAIHICKLSGATALSEAIQSLSPSLLCFDFDIPDKTGLSLLQETKQTYPTLPIVMLTDYHSEDLAVWAFHVGVRDFIVKSVTPHELFAKIMALANLRTQSGWPQKSRRCLYPQSPVPLPTIATNHTEERKRTHPALIYIAEHFHKKISLDTLAYLCHLSAPQFCRTFKKEQGMTFSEYLVRYRITKACELLMNPRTSIKAVAFEVGFTDLSYFTRIFRRYLSMPPTTYQTQVAKQEESNNGNPM